MFSAISSFFPPKPTWSTNDIPDLTGKITIVTGGNTGIGKETVKELLIHNAQVYVAARDATKAQEAIQELSKVTGKDAIFLKLDLADLKSVKASAAEFTSKESRLHILFNSAGVMFPPIEQLTADGYDLQFGTNVLGHFYFTKLLLPTLISTAKSSPNGHVRVVNTSSMGHSFAGGMDHATFKDGHERKKMGTKMLYIQSKFGNIVFSNELARRYGTEGIISVSLHPGTIQTELQRHWHLSAIENAVISWVKYPASMGAMTQLWTGTTEEGAAHNGKYLVPWARVGEARAETNDPVVATKLWDWMEEQVKDVRRANDGI